MSAAASEACVANISAAERRKRLTSGAVGLLIALGILGVLRATGASRWWRLALYPMFAIAAVGYFQWRDKT